MARGLVERYVDSVTARTGAGSWITKNLRKVFPSHFSFLWGELALYSFVVIILTGIYLTLFFEGSQETLIYTGSYEPLQGQQVSAAYDSVLNITFDVEGGKLIRQMHHWAALIFLAAITIHMARVFFTGAYRRPRDLNWMVGVTLVILAIAAGFTGYSLPDDLLSGTGLRITNAIILAIPFIGEQLAFWIFGGEWPGTDIIGRLYPVHILLIPLMIMGLLAVHLALVWHQKHTQFRGPGRTEENVIGERVWPSFALKSIGLMFLVAGVIAAMGAIFEINPIWLYGPYDSGAATSLAQPDWYVGFLEGSLRLMPPWETRIGNYVINTIFYSGVLVAGVIFIGLYLVPVIDRRFTKDTRDHHLLDRPRDAPVRTAIGMACITAITILFIGGAQDVVARTFNISVGHVTTILQISILVAPPIAFFVTRSVCLALQERPGPERTERRVPIERSADGGYGVPYDDPEVDWMLEGGAAPGAFDEITEREAVRGPRPSTGNGDRDAGGGDAEGEADRGGEAADQPSGIGVDRGERGS